MEKDRHLLNRLMEEASPAGLELPGQPLVEICGRGRVLVEGHCGVREFGRERICVGVSYGCVLVCGCGLELRFMSKHQLVITGKISSVQLQGKAG